MLVIQKRLYSNRVNLILTPCPECGRRRYSLWWHRRSNVSVWIDSDASVVVCVSVLRRQTEAYIAAGVAVAEAQRTTILENAVVCTERPGDLRWLNGVGLNRLIAIHLVCEQNVLRSRPRVTGTNRTCGTSRILNVAGGLLYHTLIIRTSKSGNVYGNAFDMSRHTNSTTSHNIKNPTGSEIRHVGRHVLFMTRRRENGRSRICRTGTRRTGRPTVLQQRVQHFIFVIRVLDALHRWFTEKWPVECSLFVNDDTSCCKCRPCRWIRASRNGRPTMHGNFQRAEQSDDRRVWVPCGVVLFWRTLPSCSCVKLETSRSSIFRANHRSRGCQYCGSTCREKCRRDARDYNPDIFMRQ